MSEKYLTFRELGALLSVGRSSIYRRIEDGTLPKPIKLGKLVRFRHSEVHIALSQLSVESVGGENQ